MGKSSTTKMMNSRDISKVGLCPEVKRISASRLSPNLLDKDLAAYSELT